MRKSAEKNVMRNIKIEKVTLNVGCGGDANTIERAKKLLNMLSGRTAIVTLSKRRSTFGITKGKPVGVMTTVRGKAAEELLKLALTGVDNKLKAQQFANPGTFSFGIHEYIDMANTKYNHEIGMMGFDVVVTLERPGFNVKRRKIKRGKIGQSHKITMEDAMHWVSESFGTNIIV